MTGGARPLLLWVLLLTLVGTVNAIWTGDLIEMATFATAICAQLTLIAFLVIAGREAIRRGAPGPRGRELLVHASAGAASTAVGFAVCVFGFAFGRFLIYLGAGMALAGLGRLAGEWRAQRRAGAGR